MPTTTADMQTARWTKKDLLGLRELSAEEIALVLRTAESFREISLRPIKKVPALIARHASSSVINAGDGAHEHPTQGLLDLFTMQEKKTRLAGLNVSIIGDIAHSRVARSNIWGLTKMGAHVTVCGPPTLIPPHVEQLGVGGVRVTHTLSEAIRGADVLMLLRIQHERQEAQLVPSLREFRLHYGITRDRLNDAKPDVLIMHPGPVNRGVELDSDVADGPFSVILDQVTNGLAVRMAVLYLVAGAGKDEHETAD